MGRNFKTRLTLALITFIISAFAQVAMGREDTLWANDSWRFFTQPAFGSATSEAFSIADDAVSVHDGKEFRFYEPSGGGQGFIAIVSPALTNATRVYTWASGVPAVGQVLKVDTVVGGAVGLGFGASGATPVFNASSVSSNVTLTSSVDTVFVSASPSPVTITLASATSGIDGKIVWVVVSENSATNTVTLDAPEAQTVNGTSTEVIVKPGASMQLVAINGNWEVSRFPEPKLREFVAQETAGANGGGQTFSGIDSTDTIEYTTVRPGSDESFASLASDQITITRTGSYEVCVKASAFTNFSFNIHLYNVTDNERYESVSNNDNANAGGNRTYFCNTYDLDKATTFEANARYSTSGSRNWLCPNFSSIARCIFTEFIVRKLK